MKDGISPKCLTDFEKKSGVDYRGPSIAIYLLHMEYKIKFENFG